jgi:threonine dehydrogenase-like Zn-dependent dehydrogenase
VDKLPFGAIVNKAITIKSGQTHVHRYMQPLLDRIERGEIDPSFIISHRLSLDDGPIGYEMFRDKADECVKVVLKP